MTLGSSIKQMMESFARALAITSASPEHTNKVKEVEYFGEVGNFDEVLSADVVQIIKEEIKIQMTVNEEISKDKNNPLRSVDSQIASNITKGVGVAKNPAGFAMGFVSKIPHAALVLLAVSMVPMIINLLTKPGGAYDIRWRRILEKEINGFMDRQTQRNTALGLRGVRIQSNAGFIQLNGTASANTMDLAKNPTAFFARNDQIGFDASKVGYF